MKRTITFHVALATLMNLYWALCHPAAYGQTITANASGPHDNLYYVFWQDTGSASMTLLDGGHYTAEWGSDTNNWFGGIGWNPAGNPVVNYSGDYSPSQDSNSYLSIYGWTKNPLAEFYIMESWGTWNPRQATTSQYYGSFESDGANYDVYYSRRTSGININAQEYITYYSIRQEKKPHGQISGTVTTMNHFNTWAKMGMALGERQYLILATESYQGRGTADITVSEGEPNCGVSDGMPVCCTIEADEDFDGYGEQFSGDVCVVTENTLGGHPANPEDVLAAINVGGLWESYAVEGIWYDANRYVSGASYITTKDPVSGDDSPIYQSAGSGNMTIDIPVAGRQTVAIELGAVEYRYTSAGNRLMSVTVEGQEYYSDVDLFAEVGHNALWLSDPIEVEVTDGILNIEITSDYRRNSVLSSVLVRSIEQAKPSNPTAIGGAFSGVSLWLLAILGTFMFAGRLPRKD